MTDYDESKGIASFALSQLLQKDSSVESAVRAVLRVAALRGHSWWEVWANLQLVTIGEDKNGMRKALDELGRKFPSIAQRDQIFDDAAKDLKHCRTDEDGQIFTEGVGQIERRLSIREQRQALGVDEVRASDNSIREALFRIKNRAQLYLQSVECGADAPKASDFVD